MVGRHPLPAMLPKSRALAAGDVDLVENATIREMHLLRIAPATERLVDGDQASLDELSGIPGGNLRLLRAIEVFGGQFLAFRRVQVFEVGLGDLARTPLVNPLVDHRDRRFGQNGQ